MQVGGYLGLYESISWWMYVYTMFVRTCVSRCLWMCASMQVGRWVGLSVVITRSKAPDPPGLTHGMWHRHAGGGGGLWQGSKGALAAILNTLKKTSEQPCVYPWWCHGSAMVVPCLFTICSEHDAHICGYLQHFMHLASRFEFIYVQDFLHRTSTCVVIYSTCCASTSRFVGTYNTFCTWLEYLWIFTTLSATDIQICCYLKHFPDQTELEKGWKR